MRSKIIFNSWSKIKPRSATHERILENIQNRVQDNQRPARSSNWKAFTPVAACIFMVLALAVTVPLFVRNYGGDPSHIFIPREMHDVESDILYNSDAENGAQGYTHLSDGDAPPTGTQTPIEGAPPLVLPDISEHDSNHPTQPVTPPAPSENLTFEQSITDPDFGKFIPTNVPPEFTFDHAWRFYAQDINSLTAFWQANAYSIRWQISTPTDNDLEHIVSITDREKFDLSLYTIPWADSVPRELMQYVMNPVFLADELSLEIIHARAIQGQDRSRNGSTNWQINFSVLFDGAVVSLNTNGVSPEYVWEMILSLK